MVDSLCHAAILRRPSSLTLEAAKEETVGAILAYLERKSSLALDRNGLHPRN